MRVQIIEKDGQPEWAVVPYEAYQQLVAQAEMLLDVQAYDETKQAIDTGDEELIPSEFAERLIDGENAVLVWRDYRGLTQQTLAAQVGITTAELAQLESGQSPSAVVLQRLAEALNVALEDLT